ncbi:MAG: hypothetical protein FK733_13330 [Asgard group archaeon]|nr:hypothetical protein [Asgard group archaeon]
MSCERVFSKSEIIGKGVISADDVVIGKIVEIIDQPDNDQDDTNKLCDIDKDLFQVGVELDPTIFPALTEPMKILFSSQVLEGVTEQGMKLKFPKDYLNSQIEQST